MSTVVGIICEYNPFHKGHLYQIEQIRNEVPDATVIAIMSGNIVQRGEFALFDKYDRAKIAMECGVNAVFELPYPYSGSTAEVFAKAGVQLAWRLGCDYLYFGSECGEVDFLEKVAGAIDSEEFKIKLKEELKHKEASYVTAKKRALSQLGIDLTQGSNDMLGIEYIRAIKKGKYPISYRTVKRVGAEYCDTSVCDIMSATAIRKNLYDNGELLSVPQNTRELYDKLISNGKFLDRNKAMQLLHSHVLLYEDTVKKAFDSSKEVSALIIDEAKNARRSQEFFDNLNSKVYTTSRLKRVLLYSLFNVVGACESVDFTILLAMDARGQQLLNHIKKIKRINVITKHSDSRQLEGESIARLELVYNVDKIYRLLLSNQQPPSDAYKKKPEIKN